MTSENLDKRFIFRLAGGEEMIHLAHLGPGAESIGPASPCRSCWGPRCRPRQSRPASAPCCQAAPPRCPRSCSTDSSGISWTPHLLSVSVWASLLGWRDPLACARPVPAVLNGGLEILPVTPPAHKSVTRHWSAVSSVYLKLHFLPPVQM